MSADRSTRAQTATDCALVGLVALIVFALHGFNGFMDRDLGVFTYGGQRVAAGVPPYVGIFNSVGPLSDGLPGLAIWVGRQVGVGAVSAERHLFLVIAAACCVLLYVVGRDVLGSRAGGLVAAAVLLTFQDFAHLASNGPREKTAMVLFLLATLALLNRRHWAVAGVTTALATLTWQPVFAVAVAAALVSILGARSGRLHAALVFVGGGVATTVVFAGYFWVQGALRVAVEGFVVVNAVYTHQPSLLTKPGVITTFLWNAYHASVLVVPVGLLVLLFVAARAVPRARRAEEDPSALPLVSAGAGCLAATAWTIAVINGPPDIFVVLPFAALGIAAVVVALAALLPSRAGMVVVAVVVLVAVVVATTVGLRTRNNMLLRQRADVAAVLAAVPRHSQVLSINAPQVLALSNRTNPTPYQIFDSPMDRYLQATYPGGLQGYARWIVRHRPTLIAFSEGRHQQWPKPVLRRYYRFAGTAPGWSWYVARTAGPHTWAAVARAIDRTRHHASH